MEKITFKIRARKGAKPTFGLPQFVLQQDDWNDYCFRTQYQLYYYSFNDNDNGKTDEKFIGTVKILKQGQLESDGLQIQEDFELLAEDFCSVGESLDYYERLSSLGIQIRTQVLVALRDVVQTPSLIDAFSSEQGWSISLFRDQKDVGTEFRQLAVGLITGDYTSLPTETLTFSFNIPGWQEAANFDFEAPTVLPIKLPKSAPLPGRISILVGRNGSGKSTLLARLARVAFGTVSERSSTLLSELGQIEPNGIGFPRIIYVTFSPFDSFKLPGSDERNRQQLLKDLEKGEGRFVFIGLRDIAAELSSEPTKDVSANALDDTLHGDRLGQTRLKSIDKLANEFETSLIKIRHKSRGDLLKRVWCNLLSGSSFAAAEGAFGERSTDFNEKQEFLSSSTGHKIVLLIASGLIANIEPRSLVLMDEPETHLHPPLLAALMHVLRQILLEHKAFAIVATHSPVVVQESLAQHVKVVRREGTSIAVTAVPTETFGESIGRITAEVFGLQSDTTDFHNVLDGLVQNIGDLEKIESLFLDGAMSDQARAYVMSRLSIASQG